MEQYDLYKKAYLQLISQQVDMIDNDMIPQQQPINMDIDLDKVLTIDQFERVKQINKELAAKRTSNRVNTSFFVQLAESKPVILLAKQQPKLKYFCTGEFHGVQLTDDPWIPVISLFLQANHRTYNVMAKGNPVPNVYPVIYTPSYVTDQFKTYGENEIVDKGNNAYWGTEWIPDSRDRAKATLMLSHLYKTHGDITILVNDNGTLIEKPLKELWMFKGLYTRKSYPDALIDSNKFSSSLIKDYGRYTFRESKEDKTRKKLILEKKQRLLSK